MAIDKKLKEFLDKNKVKYAVKKHVEVYTAQETAHAQHVPGRFMAKSVILNMDGRLILIVLPAHYLVDVAKFKKLTGAKKVRLASEEEFADAFPGCDVGAMPPFGNLYNVPVGVDKTLAADEVIVFNGGSHTDTVTMKYKDFERLVKPKIGPFGYLPDTSGKKK